MNLCDTCKKTQCHVIPMQDCSSYQSKDNCEDINCKYHDTDMKFNCSHGIIVQCCYKSKEKVIENKVLFEMTELEARNKFSKIIPFMFLKTSAQDEFFESFITNMKNAGYIRKSPVEEAEEMYASIKENGWNLTPLEVTQYDAIQYLKAENERIKK